VARSFRCGLACYRPFRLPVPEYPTLLRFHSPLIELDVRICRIRLSNQNSCFRPRKDAWQLPERFWIVMAGGKNDFTAKWWDPAGYQAVVDHFQGRLAFVQCGEQGHWHPKLRNVVDLIGATTTREFVRLMYHAEGVLCPVTFAMHLASADSRAGPLKRGSSHRSDEAMALSEAS
jgi:hypothetical protein